PLNYLVLLSILPFCAALGYLTPLLIDILSQGNPEVAGKGYALNILGCIAGPLTAGYVLLPCFGARLSLTYVALPLFVLAGFALAKPARMGFALVSGALLWVCVTCGSWEEGSGVPNKVVRRDYAATVVSLGTGMNKEMLVNGTGMTKYT